jgi:hypothetical protein
MTRRHRTPRPVAAQSVTRCAPPDPAAAHTVVLTSRVHTGSHEQVGVRRRAVLRAVAVAAAAAPVASCGWLDGDPDPPPTPDPIAPMVAETATLAARYEVAARTQPTLAGRLTPIAAAHTAHAAELSRLTSTALPSAMTVVSASGSPAETLDELRQAETAARDAAVAACLSAPADRAVLVGTIAAARATHLEALK